MNKQQFDYMVTNLIAIVNHTFTMQCGEFATAQAQDEAQAPDVSEFNVDKHLAEFDFDEMLASGYRGIADVSDILDGKRERADLAIIDSHLTAMPSNLGDLCEKLSGVEFQQWLRYALKAEQGDSLYQLHAYLANHSEHGDDDLSDQLREAIAFDELEGLRNIQSIPSHKVKIEDFTMAATIESFKVFAWMAGHAELDENQKRSILTQQMEFPNSFFTIYPMLAPNNKSRSFLLSKAESFPPIHQYLQNL